MRNLDELEPQIRQEMERPVEDVEDIQKELDNFRVSLQYTFIVVDCFLLSLLYRACTIDFNRRKAFFRPPFRHARPPRRPSPGRVHLSQQAPLLFPRTEKFRLNLGWKNLLIR